MEFFSILLYSRHNDVDMVLVGLSTGTLLNYDTDRMLMVGSFIFYDFAVEHCGTFFVLGEF